MGYLQTTNSLTCLFSVSGINNYCFNPLPDDKIVDWSKLKQIADDNLKFEENGRKLFKPVENTVGKKENLLVTSNFSFSHSVFKGFVSQGRQKVSLCGNGLRCS